MMLEVKVAFCGSSLLAWRMWPNIVSSQRLLATSTRGSSATRLREMGGYYGTSVSPIFVACGKGVKHVENMKRIVRQVDVAPTVAALLGVPMPADCEGAPVYQMLED